MVVYIKLFGTVKFLILSSIPVEETVNSSCEINHCVLGCEKAASCMSCCVVPCAAVQQLPHVKRGACDWTVGGKGGEMLWFHSVTVGGSVLNVRNKLHIVWKVVNYLKKIKLIKFFKFYTKLWWKRTNFCKTKWSVL